MIALEVIGWLLAIGITTILFFNIPMSLLRSLCDKILYGSVLHHPVMPFWMILLGLIATVTIGVIFEHLFGADPKAVKIACSIRCVVYLMASY